MPLTADATRRMPATNENKSTKRLAFEYRNSFRHSRLECKEQPILYRSLLKYGIENHIFEIIEECELDKLNIIERYWQDFYDVTNREKGLNCSLTKTDVLTSQLNGRYKNYTSLIYV